MAGLVVVASGAVLSGLWSGISGVFQYNQQKWQFDKEMKQERAYFAHEMAAQQVAYWREDLRDLFDTINDKMNSYTLCSTLVAGFSITLEVDAHTDHTTPPWLFILASLQIAAAFAYSVLSLMFSIYASVVVRQLKTKTMTEIVRVPIPTEEAIRRECAHNSETERVDWQNVGEMMHVPIISQFVKDKVRENKERKGKYIRDSDKKPMSMVQGSPHLAVFHKLQESWMPLVKFAHICMTSSLICLIHGIMFMSIGNHLGSGLQIGGTLCIVLVLTTTIILILKVEMFFTQKEWLSMVLMHFVPSMLSFSIQLFSTMHSTDWALYCTPPIYFCQGAWIVTLMQAADPGRQQPSLADNGESRSRFRLASLQDMHFSNQGQLASNNPTLGNCTTNIAMQSSFCKQDHFVKTSTTSFSSLSSKASPASGSTKASPSSLLSSSTQASLMSEMEVEPGMVNMEVDGPMPSPSVMSVDSFAGSMISPSVWSVASGSSFVHTDPTEARHSMRNQHRFAAMLLRSLAAARKHESRRFKVAKAHFEQLSEAFCEPVDFQAAEPCMDPRAEAFPIAELGGFSCTRCVAGHIMRACSGGEARRFQEHWCSLCLKNLNRKDRRHTCDFCAQFEVCTECAETFVEQEQVLRFNTFDRPRRLERMLRNVLADMQKKSARYLEVAPLDPSADPKAPIKADRLEEALHVERTLKLEELPWQIFRTLSSVIVLCFFMALMWSLLQICTGQTLGRPHAIVTTGAEHYLDLAGEAEGDRRLLRDPPGSLELASRAPGAWSSSAEVADWLRAQELPAAAQEARRRGVDGPMLRNFDESAWKELGVSSAVERARLATALQLQGKEFERRPRRLRGGEV